MVSLIASILLLASTASPASSPAELQRARQLFERGRADYRSGQFRLAIAEFLEADRIKPAPALSYNVAAAYEKLGDQAKAVSYYQEYLLRAPDAPDRPAVEATIQNLQAHMQGSAAAPVVVMAEPAAAPPVAPAEISPAPAAAVHAPAAEEKSHFVPYALGGLGVALAAGAIFGAVQVANYAGTRSAIVSGSTRVIYSQAVAQQGAAAVWGPTAIALALVAAAGLTGAVLTW